MGRSLSFEKVDDIKNYIQDTPTASCLCIARIMEIDKKTNIRIITENLHLKKVLLKWVPHLLTTFKIAKLAEISNELLKIFMIEPLHQELASTTTTSV